MVEETQLFIAGGVSCYEGGNGGFGGIQKSKY